MHETSDFFYSIITFSYTKYFVHSYTVDVVFTLSYYITWGRIHKYRSIYREALSEAILITYIYIDNA